MTQRRRFALVAGESSGDLLGADLMRGLAERFPGAEFAGVGGEAMAAAGLERWHDAQQLAVMGFAEVLSMLPRLLRIRRDTLRRVQAWRPDAFVGIDAPDFNLGVERRLKERGIPTVHYVSPSVWAWRSGRVAKIGRSADRVLTLFPFEPAIYREHGVAARFVGHPLAEAYPERPDAPAMRRQLGIPEDGPLLAVLPGSRRNEIERLGPVFAEAMATLAERGVGFVAPMATPGTGARFRDLVSATAPRARVHWLEGQAREALQAADLALLASGTAALEAMLAKRPMVVAYRISPLTYWIVTTFGLMEIDRYSLPNVLAGEPLVPEILQDALTPGALLQAIGDLLDNEAARERQVRVFERLHESLRAPRNAHAEAIAELLEAGP